MRFDLDVKGIVFDRAKYERAIHQDLTECLTACIKAWAEATALSIPVWKGWARGQIAYAPVHGASDLKSVVKARIPISPLVSSGTSPQSAGSTYAESSVTIKKYIYQFEWQSTLSYYELNETTDVSALGIHLTNPTPWRSLLAGDVAFMAALDNFPFTRIRDFSKYLRFV